MIRWLRGALWIGVNDRWLEVGAKHWRPVVMLWWDEWHFGVGFRFDDSYAIRTVACDRAHARRKLKCRISA